LLLGAISVPLALRPWQRNEPTGALTPPVDAASIVVESPVIDATLVAQVEPPPADAPSPPPVVHRHVAPPVDAPVVEDAPPVPPPSDLPVQIELYNQARAAAAARDFTGALDKLEELLRRFPQSPLRADAELTRADVLARANRLPDAANAFEALARDDMHRGRRGELLRTLGDLYRQLHDCTHATEAYTRALAEHLNEKDRADAQRGRDRCNAPKKP
jgi:TolA-binding protein